MYSPSPRLVSHHPDLRDLEGLTNEGVAVAVGKDMAHEPLCVDASKFVTRIGRRKDGLGNLKVFQRKNGRRQLQLLVRIVRA